MCQVNSQTTETIHNGSVLVVEDALNWAGFYKTQLGKMGLPVKIARSYPEALGLLRHETFILAIIDLQLTYTVKPKNLEGIFLLLPLTKKRIPVIVVSGWVTSQLADKIYRDFPPVYQILDKSSFFDTDSFVMYVNRAISAVMTDNVNSFSDHEQQWSELDRLTREIIKKHSIVTLDQNTSAESVVNQCKPKIVKLFLASSKELTDHRKEFEFFINRQNKFYFENENTFLKLELWEDSIDAMARNRLQDAYNRTIKECDIFVMLYWTKVGEYTAEEFETAFGHFKETNRPLVYTYEHNANLPKENFNRQEAISLFDFKDRLKSLGHFPTQYANVDELKLKFNSQLLKILPKLVTS